MEAANALERSRQTAGGEGTGEKDDDKLEDRAVLDAKIARRALARKRIENVKRFFVEHPEVKIAMHLMSMAVALSFMKFLLENGKQEW